MESAVFLKVRGTQVGPLSPDELKQMVRQKKVRPDDQIWDEQQEQWSPLTESELIRNLLLKPEAVERVLLAIGGGKGGVGKTAITVSLGVALAGMGQKVVIVDADFGGANLHNFLGIENPAYTYLNFYTMEKSSLNEIVLPTKVENLSFISGACGTLGLANPKYSQKVRFIQELKKINADYILLDLGAGSSYNVIDYFLATGEGIVVSTPEPASIQETFYFIRQALLRKLSRTFKNQQPVAPLFQNGESIWHQSRSISIKDLYKEVEKMDKDSASIFRGILQKFQPKLILNMIMKSEEVLEGVSLKTAVGELLSIELDFWGAIPYDERVREAAMLQKPFMQYKPNSRAAKQVSQIVSRNLLQLPRLRGFVERRRLQKLLSRLEVPATEMVAEPMICSVKCGYWDECEYQNGGYPCEIRKLETTLKNLGKQ